ncbi:MAG: MlaE family lipid ABC transporter permease subunit [Alphaproteobacteria bacterium]|nr:MlaE family lipid ABC transporter permease subunit [Alphaproteobacteria bacterium]MBV9551850.1 MlaE family lipid ABC transporter permease subunit [Alphaproteobacteria bacterium]
MAAAATILASEERGDTVLRAEGEWLVARAAELDRTLHNLQLPQGRHVTLDLSGVDRLDSAGAWLLLRTEHELAARGNRVEFANLAQRFAPLLEQVRSRGVVEPLPHPIPAHHTFVGFLERLGRITAMLLQRVYDILGFTGLVTVTVMRLFRQPRRLRVIATLVQMEVVGLNAMPIVGLLSFLIGVVMAYQGADQLRRFGAEIYTVNLLGISVLRELGVLLSAIIIAGRSGSAFTAQIGTMQVNEEIDALRTLGLDPVEVLVLPRLFGLGITLPLIVFYADFMGLLGGGLMSWAALGINPPNFFTQLHTAISQSTLWVGVLKAPFFAAIISLVGCYEGLNVTRSAESVGRLTTQSVVESIFFVIVTDAVFSIVFSMLKI